MLLKNKPLGSKGLRWFGFCVALVVLYSLTMAGVVHADPLQILSKQKIENPSFFAQSIRVYQKILSRADGDRCPMYPSCSTFAKQAFHKHGPVKGWILTSDRLLRCGHDEVKRSGRIRINGKYVTPDPLDKNDFLFK